MITLEELLQNLTKEENFAKVLESKQDKVSKELTQIEEVLANKENVEKELKEEETKKTNIEKEIKELDTLQKILSDLNNGKKIDDRSDEDKKLVLKYAGKDSKQLEDIKVQKNKELKETQDKIKDINDVIGKDFSDDKMGELKYNLKLLNANSKILRYDLETSKAKMNLVKEKALEIPEIKEAELQIKEEVLIKQRDESINKIKDILSTKEIIKKKLEESKKRETQASTVESTKNLPIISEDKAIQELVAKIEAKQKEIKNIFDDAKEAESKGDKDKATQYRKYGEAEKEASRNLVRQYIAAVEVALSNQLEYNKILVQEIEREKAQVELSKVEISVNRLKGNETDKEEKVINDTLDNSSIINQVEMTNNSETKDSKETKRELEVIEKKDGLFKRFFSSLLEKEPENNNSKEEKEEENNKDQEQKEEDKDKEKKVEENGSKEVSPNLPQKIGFWGRTKSFFGRIKEKISSRTTNEDKDKDKESQISKLDETIKAEENTSKDLGNTNWEMDNPEVEGEKEEKNNEVTLGDKLYTQSEREDVLNRLSDNSAGYNQKIMEDYRKILAKRTEEIIESKEKSEVEIDSPER